MPKKICLLTTGGTITMIHDSQQGGLRPPDTPLDLYKTLPELTQLEALLPEQPQLTHTEFLMNIDSSNMNPTHWQQIAQAIFARRDDYDAFVVTHGTDTMAYTGSALAFMLHTLNKPIILTGAQVPLTGGLVMDARNNLINAFRIAALAVERQLYEVLIVFGSKVLRATRSIKHSVFDFDAFTSFNAPEVARIGLRYQFQQEATAPKMKSPCLLQDTLDERVALLKVTPGLSPQVVEAIAHTDLRGLVIEGFGAGNLPYLGAYSLLPSIEGMIARGIAVVITTQAQIGAAEMFYVTGAEFIRAGAISGADMTSTSAVVKLMWVLGNFGDALESVKAHMHTNYAEEIDIRLLG
ncbi:MAG: asparaginase [Phototrophicaceae bacterium]